MKATLKCHGCEQQFPRGDMVNHTSPRSKTGYNYCPNCLKEALAKEMFTEKVCHIFGIKTPGSRIWGDRKKLINEYGYTDQTIVDTLDYIYGVEGLKPTSKSLTLVTPANIEKMMKYKRRKDYEENKIVSAFVTGVNNKIEPRRIHIRENTTEKPNWSIDDEFFDD